MKQWVESNDVVVLKADKSNPSPEIDQLLVELGNSTKALPYYALMRPNDQPVHFNGGYASTSQFLAQLGEVPVQTEKGKQNVATLEDAGSDNSNGNQVEVQFSQAPPLLSN